MALGQEMLTTTACMSGELGSHALKRGGPREPWRWMSVMERGWHLQRRQVGEIGERREEEKTSADGARDEWADRTSIDP